MLIAGIISFILCSINKIYPANNNKPETIIVNSDVLAKDADDTENPATNNSPREDTSQNVNSSAENNIQNDDSDILYHEGLPADTLNSIILQASQSENVGYEIINNNVPFFTEEDITLASQGSYEFYSELDDLGRCGFCIASIGQDLMPTEERESIGTIKPTGWVQNKYKGIISSNSDDPQYLYNRCHLIAYCLTAENANEKNLITGTRYMNLMMTNYEIPVAEYVETTGDHVLYRVTPVFEGDNLLASGVLIEAKSCTTDEISCCVYLTNIQPGITIDYSTGDNWISETTEAGKKNQNSNSESKKYSKCIISNHPLNSVSACATIPLTSIYSDSGIGGYCVLLAT